MEVRQMKLMKQKVGTKEVLASAAPRRKAVPRMKTINGPINESAVLTTWQLKLLRKRSILQNEESRLRILTDSSFTRKGSRKRHFCGNVRIGVGEAVSSESTPTSVLKWEQLSTGSTPTFQTSLLMKVANFVKMSDTGSSRAQIRPTKHTRKSGENWNGRQREKKTQKSSQA